MVGAHVRLQQWTGAFVKVDEPAKHLETQNFTQGDGCATQPPEEKIAQVSFIYYVYKWMQREERAKKEDSIAKCSYDNVILFINVKKVCMSLQFFA